MEEGGLNQKWNEPESDAERGSTWIKAAPFVVIPRVVVRVASVRAAAT
ncbi:hypothetical protein [Rhodovulum sp. PH10]|nr:hypothetical protein [Rhodovulum sp. PH10]